MYINTKVVLDNELNLQQVVLMQLLKQNKNEDLSEWLESYNGDIDVLRDKGFISEVKPKTKKESPYKRLRLSDKGNSTLEDLLTPEVHEDDKKICDWLVNHYKKLGKDIGNRKRTERHIRDFRVQSGIIKNNLVKLCLDFLSENEEQSRVLEYVWYYPKTAFATKFNIYDSWLFKHYEKNKERLDLEFEKYE